MQTWTSWTSWTRLMRAPVTEEREESPASTGVTVLAVLLTCHNRRDTTVRCLTALTKSIAHYQAEDATALTTKIYLVDDGSTDGTADAVSIIADNITVIKGTGDLYWARGMVLARSAALRSGRLDFFLWLNDDVVLDPNALCTLFASSARLDIPFITVGALIDPTNGRLSYSGVRRFGRHPLSFRLVRSGDSLPCDTFNGNAVLIPFAVDDSLAGLDARYDHAMADFDYGLRARSLRIPTLVTTTSVGLCARNSPAGTSRDASLRVLVRWRLFIGRAELPPLSWGRMLRMHGGKAWPLLWIWPYAKFWLTVNRRCKPLVG